MTIKSMEHYANAAWDWGFLDKCWKGTKIKVSDLDGIVERNGHFLVLETKWPNAPITKAQSIMFEAMVQSGLFTVIIIWGKKPKPEKVLYMGAKGRSQYPNATEELVCALAEEWFEWANSQNQSRDRQVPNRP